MKRHRRQLFTGLPLLLVATVVTGYLHRRHAGALPGYAFLTGWVLLAAMLVLTFYNVWKKLPFLPFGRSEFWLQLHLYLGYFTVVLFLVHLNFRPPRGVFEIVLAALFTFVSASGVVGILLSRVLPRRLATRGGEVIYEKIPALRVACRTQAEALAVGPDSQSVVIGEFYLHRLADFFARPRNFWWHLAESRRPVAALLRELEDVQRTGSEAERVALAKLAELVRQKDGLDYHRSVQLSLKLWLFVHIPLTYGLLVFTALHLALVYGFSGGAR